MISVDEDKDNLLQDEEVLKIISDARFEVIINSHSRGFVSNFQNGLLRLLANENVWYFVCSDQDDEWGLNMLEIQSQRIRNCPSGSLVFCDLAVQKVLGNDRREIFHESIWKAERRNVTMSDPRSVLFRNLVSGASGMFDRHLAEQCLPFPSWIKFHDHFLAVKAALCGGLYPIYESLYSYNQHGENVVGGSTFTGVFSSRNQSRLKLEEKYKYLKLWMSYEKINPPSLLILLNPCLFYKDPGLYRSYLGYFLGKYFG